MARDYTFVADTCAGIFGAIERVSKNQKVYETYNLGNSTPVSLKELITAIEETTGEKCLTEHQEVPLGDVPITFANIERAKKNLNYDPQTPLKKGLEIFHQWMKEN